MEPLDAGSLGALEVGELQCRDEIAPRGARVVIEAGERTPVVRIAERLGEILRKGVGDRAERRSVELDHEPAILARGAAVALHQVAVPLPAVALTAALLLAIAGAALHLDSQFLRLASQPHLALVLPSEAVGRRGLVLDQQRVRLGALLAGEVHLVHQPPHVDAGFQRTDVVALPAAGPAAAVAPAEDHAE